MFAAVYQLWQHLQKYYVVKLDTCDTRYKKKHMAKLNLIHVAKEVDVFHVLQWHFSGSKINFIFGVYHLMLFWEAFFEILRKYDGFSHKIMYTCRALASKDTKRFRKDAFVEIFQKCCTLHMEENKLTKHFSVLQYFSWVVKMCRSLLTQLDIKKKRIYSGM